MKSVTLTALANSLGKSRKAIYNAIGRGMPGPDSKGRYDLDGCRQFFQAEEHNKQGTEKHREAKRLLESRRLLRHCEKAELELAILRRDYLAAAEVRQEVSRMVSVAKTLLLSLPSQLSATVVGLSPAQAEREIREAVIRALEQLSANPWADSPPEATSEQRAA